ncbi:GAF domain-containing protein [Actinoplanes subtropicus]|uniref:GAF domain-containing protein n=1 Tax=Actinoplanes subtropicus TaxID=543632 RepID=UPI0012FB198D|nr:GAF domain-containing protein [Actinoplanes subtropicus]
MTAPLPVLTVGAALSSLADTRGEDFHLPGFLDRLTGYCVNLLDVSGAGVMLAGADGGLSLLATSGEETRRLELNELDRNDGPCVDAYRRGHAITHHRFEPDGSRWADLARTANSAGFRGSHAITMRHGHQIIGVLNLFRSTGEALPYGEQLLGRMLADVATAGLLQNETFSAYRSTPLPGAVFLPHRLRLVPPR